MPHRKAALQAGAWGESVATPRVIGQDGLYGNGGTIVTNSAQPSEVGPEHPLDPLTAREIRRAAAILRRDREIGESWRFASIELREPAKAALTAAGREAIVVGWDRADGQAHRAVVSLTEDAVTSWEYLPGQQPNMTVDEWHECDQMLRGRPEVIEALARRGITDMSLVLTDMWAYGAALVPERYRGLRLGWCDVWYRDSEDSNP
jgi:primary-amine oxidase